MLCFGFSLCLSASACCLTGGDVRMAQPVKLLADEDRAKVLGEWGGINGIDQSIIPPKCVHQLFMETAARLPEKVAVEFEDDKTQTLTYAQLDAISNRIANHLRGLGAQPDDMIGVCVSRSPMMLAAMLGIMKSGAGYVALDPKFPEDRLAYIVEEAGIKHIVVEESLIDFVETFVELLQKSETQVRTEEFTVDNILKQVVTTIVTTTTYKVNMILLNSFASKTIDPATDTYQPTDVMPHHLAYAIYTSGSTGKPKGVLLPHRGVVNFLLCMQRSPGLKESDRLLAVTTICFDISVLELFLPVITGATVVVVGGKSRDGVALMDLIRATNVNLMQATPATWSILLESGWKGQSNLKVLCGGEPMPVSLANRLTPIIGELWNMYGPTETTVWCTIHHVKGQIEKPPPIGRPIPNTTAYILDMDTRQPVAPGEQGQLWLGGEQCARGYNKRPEITAEKFIRDPFRTDVPNPIMYDSGDLARFNEDGEIVCCGRADYQVKINGFRIELGEIEAALDLHPTLKQNVVTVKEIGGAKQLVAYVVARPEAAAQFSIKSLQEHVEKRCTPYMVPSVFIQLEALPLLPNGKVNRHALPAPSTVKAKFAEEVIEEAADEYERVVVGFCEELLSIKPISTTANLFAMGGNSLFAVKLHNKIKAHWQVEVPVGSILQKQNVQLIAREVHSTLQQQQGQGEEASDKDKSKIIVPINPIGGNRPPLFLFHAAGGFIFPYFSLVKHIPNQPMYGIQDPALNDHDLTDSPDTIEKMAELYTSKLVAFYPQGPYYLGGWSMGAFLAYEVAVRLTAMGREVPLVIMVDQPPKEPTYSRTGTWITNITNSTHLIKQQVFLRHEKLKEEKSVLRRGFFGILSKVLSAKDAGQELDASALGSGATVDPSLTNLVHFLDQHMKMSAKYNPPAYGGTALILRAVENDNLDVFTDWYKICPNMTVRDIPGSHYTCHKEPNAKELARQMEAMIDYAVFLNTQIPREGGDLPHVVGYGEFDMYTNTNIVYHMGQAVDRRGSLRRLTTTNSLFGSSRRPSAAPRDTGAGSSIASTTGVVNDVNADFESFTLMYNHPDTPTEEHVIVHNEKSDLQEMKSRAKKRLGKYLMQKPIVITRGTVVHCVFTVRTSTGIKGLKLIMDVAAGDSLLPFQLTSQEIIFGDVPQSDEIQNLRFCVFQTKAGSVVRVGAGRYVVTTTIFDEVGHVLFRMKGPIRIVDAKMPIPSHRPSSTGSTHSITDAAMQAHLQSRQSHR